MGIGEEREIINLFHPSLIYFCPKLMDENEIYTYHKHQSQVRILKFISLENETEKRIEL